MSAPSPTTEKSSRVSEADRVLKIEIANRRLTKLNSYIYMTHKFVDHLERLHEAIIDSNDGDLAEHVSFLRNLLNRINNDGLKEMLDEVCPEKKQ